jgi:hypothetical protein
VFADTSNPWFRDSFTRIGDLEHHVAAQAAFWEDIMGGGRRYHGGEYRLQFHHTNNAAAVMNSDGAARWMHHMRRSLQTHARELTLCDIRVVPCILQVHISGCGFSWGVEFSFSVQSFAKCLMPSAYLRRAVPSCSHAEVRSLFAASSALIPLSFRFLTKARPQVRKTAQLAARRGRFCAS